MRKSTGKIGTLPWAVRDPINVRLRDEKKLRVVSEWLFGVPDEAGVPYAARWLEGGATTDADRERALHACDQALSVYRRSPAYQAWLVEDKRNGNVGRALQDLAAIGKVGTEGSPDEGVGVRRYALSLA